METPAIQIVNATFSHMGAKAPVWENVCCSFAEGAVNVIAGPSGCGKSTLLQAINGLVPHINEGRFSGRVFYNGEDVTEWGPRERCKHIGYVMQDPESQFCAFTVEEELAFGAENLGYPASQIQEGIDRVLAEVGMEGFRERNLSTLSGGQKQKIAIASVLVTDPKVLLLDEPTANLDPLARREVLRLVVRLSRSRGMTVVMVEHNLEDVLDDIDYLAVMDGKGNVVECGAFKRVVGELRDPRFESLRAYLPGALWGRVDIESVWSFRTTSVEGFGPVDSSSADPSALGVSPDGPAAHAAGCPEQTDGMNPLVLRVDDVSFAFPLNRGFRKKSYGPRVLDGVNMDVRQRDFIAVVGRNGAGKSTLFNVVFRLREPQRGKVELFGRDIRSISKRELYRSMGLVFQNPELQFVTNQVDEELLASLKDEDVPDDEKHERVHAMLERYNLLPFASESPFVLSQGQKRRLSVATMLITNQKILFLDEPTYGQDQQNREELMQEMVRLNRSGVAIVMITHDIDLIRRYAKRVVMLEGGKVILDGSVGDYTRLLESEGVLGSSCDRLDAEAPSGQACPNACEGGARV